MSETKGKAGKTGKADEPSLPRSAAEHWSGLVEAARTEAAGNSVGTLRLATVWDSLAGDGDAVQRLAMSVAIKLRDGEPLSAVDSLWVTSLLVRISHNKELAQRASRPAGAKGAPKRGVEKMRMAFEVVEAILHKDAETIEGAWAIVASRRHKTPATIKAAWIERKAVVMDSLKAAGFSEADLKKALAENRAARKKRQLPSR